MDHIIKEELNNSTNNPVEMDTVNIYSQYQYNQSRLIKNYNKLVELFKENKIIHLKPLSEKGLCDGLSKLFIFYEKQQRSEEFKIFLAFINSLQPASMQTLMEECKRKKNPRIFLPHQIENKEIPAFPEYKFVNPTFKKLIYFLESVNQTQLTQLKTKYKSIGANWESSSIIYCPKNKLSEFIRKSRFLEKNTGTFKVFSNVKHVNSMHIKEEGIKHYEPNDPREPQTYHATKVLVKALTECIAKDDYVLLFIDTLSYGDYNGEFDILISKYKNIIKTHQRMQSIISSYIRGCLSRRDTSLILFHQLTLLKNPGTLFEKFKAELKNYLVHNKKNNVRNVISNLSDNNQKNYLGTPLCHACMGGQFEIVKELLMLGADPYACDESGMSLLDIAISKGYQEIAQLIEQYQSVKSVINKKTSNKKFITVAQELSDYFDAYAHPRLFSLHWRSHRKLAAEISRTLRQHSTWSVNQCDHYISLMTQHIEMNQKGTFKGVIDYVKRKMRLGLKPLRRQKLTKRLTKAGICT